tara:strand:- start:117 stop:629 length:513 start_codon:yes stop_codon:yes gene_type:complete
MLAAGLLHTAASFHLDERVFYALQSAWHAETHQARSLWLPEYQVRVEAKPVATVGNNLSGLTFDEQRNQLWAVVNNPEELIALDLNGEFIARYPLKGFIDVEAVTYLGDNLLAVAEERSQSIVILPVPTRPGELVSWCGRITRLCRCRWARRITRASRDWATTVPVIDCL